MSDDSPLPPGNSSEETEALDADEAAEASALAQALEGRSGTPTLPDAALETAALLRYSGAAGQLSNERRAALREQVLASVPARAAPSRSPRSALWRWLGLGVPLVGAAAGLWLVIGAFQRAAEPELSRYAASRDGPAEHTEERSNTASAPAPGAAAPSDEWAAQRTAANDTRADDTPAKAEAVSAMTAPQAEAEAAPSAVARNGTMSREAASGAAAPRAAGGNALRPRPAEPAADALASRIAAAPSAAPAAAPGSSRERGSGAGLGAAEAKRSAAPGAPSSARLERSSQRYRARLLPQLGDARVDQAYAALDRAQTNAELRQAQTNLTALSSGTLGSADESAISDVMRQDIFCRLAEVALRLGQPGVALDWARRGLELQAPPNPFAARLWHVDGQARAALGDQDGAAKSYLKAIEVNERLLDENLDGSE